MKIGAMIPQGWRMDLNGIPPENQWGTILKASKDIEDLNYESVWVYDHFHTVPSPTQDPTFECWSLMAALSQVTESVRIGQMCTCNSYRNPAYLTKVASTIDSMSGGRLEFAIGAGWYDQEYKAYGYEYPSAGVRLKMLEEALQIYIAMKEKKLIFQSTRKHIDIFYDRTTVCNNQLKKMWKRSKNLFFLPNWLMDPINNVNEYIIEKIIHNTIK